jgi:hypothetical protein
MRQIFVSMGAAACLAMAAEAAHAQAAVDCSAVAAPAAAGTLAAISPELLAVSAPAVAAPGPLAEPLGPPPSFDQSLLSASCGPLAVATPGAVGGLLAPAAPATAMLAPAAPAAGTPLGLLPGAAPAAAATAANIVPAVPGTMLPGTIAPGTIAPEPGSNAVIDPATYKPRTEFDNTPYRFNMHKGMTADEFTAWMEARGVRVARGAPQAAAPAPAEGVDAVDSAAPPAAAGTDPAPPDGPAGDPPPR